MAHIPSTVLIAALSLVMPAVAHPPEVLGRHQEEPASTARGLRDWTILKTGRVGRGTFLASRFNTVLVPQSI